MKKHIAFLVTIVLASTMTSCQHVKKDIARDPFPKEQAEIKKLLYEIYDCGQRKDFQRLASYHSYGPKFTEFKAGEPRHDAEEGKRKEREGLGVISDFNYDLRDLKVNVFGDVAIATFHGEFGGKTAQGPFTVKQQATMVFVKNASAWKIVHEHFSPLK